MAEDRILTELEAAYEARRQQNRAEEEKRREEACAKDPRIAKTLNARQDMILGSIRGILNGDADAEKMPERMAGLNRQLEALLEAAGYPRDYLEPVYTCPRCRDTGYVGTPLRTMCACMRSAYFKRLYAEAGLDRGQDASFETFDDSVFDGQKALPAFGGMTQRALMQRCRRRCERFADQWPQVEKRTMVLSGKSGLGKTFLMHCMARRLLERDVSAVLIPSYRFLEAARKAMFAADTAELDRIRSAQVLLLDDLGSEPLLNNVTVEQLYSLIDSRQREAGGLVVSTNLEDEQLRERYTERIASRLLGERQSLVLRFDGEDLRWRGQGGGV